jgi:hypothetical protein
MGTTIAKVLERFLKGGRPLKTPKLEYQTDGIGHFLWSYGCQLATRYGGRVWYWRVVRRQEHHLAMLRSIANGPEWVAAGISPVQSSYSVVGRCHSELMLDVLPQGEGLLSVSTGGAVDRYVTHVTQNTDMGLAE